ncbi:putative forkhead-associated (FHA) domain, SMAD/FHA domain superfamily [Plasmopara halstedii]
MTSYSPPEWSISGSNVFGIYMDVIKGGVVVESLQLPCTNGRSYVLAGRMATVCDWTLAHPSISRTHAALQFDQQGALFLYDIRSTHGCFVNKKRIPVEEFVRLHIGDVLGFGESTRLYAVCGPPELLPAEYESLNLEKFRERLKRKDDQREVSWGFKDDAEEEEGESEEETQKRNDDLPDYLRNLKEDDRPYTSSVSQSDVNEKDRRLYRQLTTRIRKMENLKLEKSRILAKQNRLDGLSEGQQLTLERNEQRIETLHKEIDDLEAKIQAKNDERAKTKSTGELRSRKRTNVNEELYGYSSDEDDFYDRTEANQLKIAARKQKVTGCAISVATAGPTTDVKAQKKEVLTVDSIQSNIKRLEEELTRLQDDVTAASTKADPKQNNSKQEKEDSLDLFMSATTTQLHLGEIDLLMKRKADIKTELQRQHHLLAVATPALASLPVRTPVKDAVDDSVITTSNVSSFAINSSDQAEKNDMIPHCSELVNVDVLAKKSVSPLQNKSIVKEKLENHRVKNAAPLKREQISGPVKMVTVSKKIKVDGEKQCGGASILEGGDHAWVPPTNQTGDGRTQLNDKFGY